MKFLHDVYMARYEKYRFKAKNQPYRIIEYTQPCSGLYMGAEVGFS